MEMETERSKQLNPSNISEVLITEITILKDSVKVIDVATCDTSGATESILICDIFIIYNVVMFVIKSQLGLL